MTSKETSWWLGRNLGTLVVEWVLEHNISKIIMAGFVSHGA